MTISRKPKKKSADDVAQEFIAGGKTPITHTSPPPVDQPKPKAAKKPVALRFDGDLLARIDAAAQSRGISRNAWISWQCAEGLKGE